MDPAWPMPPQVSEGRRPEGGLSARRRALALVLTLTGVPVLTAVLVSVRGTLSLDSVLLVYLLGVVVVAVIGGMVPALVAAGRSLPLAHWVLTPPSPTLDGDGQKPP